MDTAFLSFNLSRPRRMTELNNPAYAKSRSLPENSHWNRSTLIHNTNAPIRHVWLAGDAYRMKMKGEARPSLDK
jgi:hypothetical protein